MREIKKILVTGGAGFIGSHLCPLLRASGHVVRILDNLSLQIHGENAVPPEWIQQTGCEFVLGSVTQKDDIVPALDGIDSVIHLAAETGTGQSMYEISRYNLVNTQGTAILLDAITSDKSTKVSKILLASSRAIYGEGAYTCTRCADSLRQYPDPRTAEQLLVHQWEPLCATCRYPLTAVAAHEDDKARPASIYAATKYAQEALVEISCKAFGISYAIFRLQNVFGEGQSLNNPYTGILSIFSTRIRRRLVLPLFEDGEETRDFVHVADVAAAFNSAINVDRGPDCVMNVGTGVKTTIREIATSLSLAFNVQPELTVTAQFRLGDIRHNFADINRLKQVLDIEPAIQLKQGLDRFASWVNTQELPEDRLDKANQELITRKLMV